MPQHLGQLLALVEQPIALAQLPHDLLRRVSLPLHRDVLHPSMLGVGLSRKVDHYPGVPPAIHQPTRDYVPRHTAEGLAKTRDHPLSQALHGARSLRRTRRPTP